MIRFLTAGVSAGMLVACSSGGDDGAAPSGPSSMSLVRNTPLVSAVGTAIPGAYLITDGNVSAFIAGNTALDTGAFDAAGSSSGAMLFRAETSDGRVTLTRDTMDATGVRYERLTSTILPEGSMAYDGDYVAIVRNLDSGNVVYLINGDANLNVDFALGGVTGDITDRVVLGPSGIGAIGVTSEDITLQNGTINSQGLFSGDTADGAISAAFSGTTTTAMAGQFDGLIAGADGDLALGGLDFVHGRPGSDYLEEGAFFLDTTLVP